jgi:serine/threonine protein kinase
MASAEKDSLRSRPSARSRPSGTIGPARLGKYELIARIGKGGMAQVYLARQRGPANFEKVVVVKTIHPHLAEKKSFIDMLLDEARIAALLKHPCVVDIYDLGVDEDIYFIAMEYLSGEPLLSVLRAGRVENQLLDIHGTCRIIADVADGLHAAHELHDNAGNHLELVHRDVTPGNIVVLYNGQVKIVDFGIAKARGRLTSETDARKLKGKLGYVAPEQIRGQNADRRADIFALGVVMWEALTYRRLFRGTNPGTVLAAIVKDKLHPPSSVRREVPPELDAICLRALARDPDERYPTAQELQSDIETFLAASASMQRKSVAGYMQRVFARQIEERNRLLREMPEIGVAAGPKDATSTFAPAPQTSEDEYTSPGDTPAAVAAGTGQESAPGEAQSGQAPAAARAGSPGFAPHTPGNGLAPVMLPQVPGQRATSASDSMDEHRASNLTVGSSGEVAAARALQGNVTQNLRRRRMWLAGVGTAVVGLIVLTAVLGDDSPTPGDLAGERLFAAASEPASKTAPGSEAAGGAAEDPAPAAATPPGSGEPDPAAGAVEPAAAGEPGRDELVIFEDEPAAEPGQRGTSEHTRAAAERGEPGNATERDASRSGTPAREPDRTRSAAEGGAGGRKRAEALYNEGAALFVKGELAPAQLKFREALQLAPGYAPAYRGMGMVHQASGQRKQAARAYQQYLRLAPKARDRGDIEARLVQVKE